MNTHTCFTLFFLTECFIVYPISVPHLIQTCGQFRVEICCQSRVLQIKSKETNFHQNQVVGSVGRVVLVLQIKDKFSSKPAEVQRNSSVWLIGWENFFLLVDAAATSLCCALRCVAENCLLRVRRQAVVRLDEWERGEGVWSLVLPFCRFGAAKLSFSCCGARLVVSLLRSAPCSLPLPMSR